MKSSSKRVHAGLMAGAMAAAIATPALAATAFFTGKQEMVQTVTNQMAWRCEYQYAGKYFWRVYLNGCPSTIEVQ